MKKELIRWSLLGFVEHLSNIATQWDWKAAKVEADFRTLHLSDTAFWPGMRRLFYLVQQLVLAELHRGMELLAEGVKPRPLGDELECDCLFFRQYQLPCSHMWQQEQLFEGVLKDEEVWEQYAFMFEDCGFEIYEGIGVTYSTKELGEEIGAPAKWRLEVSLLLLLQVATNTLHRSGRSVTVFCSGTTVWRRPLKSSRRRREMPSLGGGLLTWER